MKIKIDYSISETFLYPRTAHTKIDDSEFWSSGQTWQKAKEAVIKQAKEYLEVMKHEIPEPEEVEV